MSVPCPINMKMVSALQFSVTRCHCCWFCFSPSSIMTKLTEKENESPTTNRLKYMRSSVEYKQHRAHTNGSEWVWNCMWTMWTVKSEDNKKKQQQHDVHARIICRWLDHSTHTTQHNTTNEMPNKIHLPLHARASQHHHHRHCRCCCRWRSLLSPISWRGPIFRCECVCAMCL